MRHDLRRTARSRLAPALAGLLVAGAVQADAFTYSGRLDEFGAPANGRYDLRLAVHADQHFGNTIVTPVEYAAVEVVDGAFRVDFDLPPGHAKAWVELAIRPAGSTSWVALPGRTEAISAPAAIGQCWSSTGDDGSNPALNFLGTTDAQPLVLRTRNVQSLRLEPSTVLSGAAPITANVIAGSSANNVSVGVRGATVSGGGISGADPDFSGGGGPNRVTDHYGVVAGGLGNQAGDLAGTLADRSFATVGGGAANVALGRSSTVSGGVGNDAGAESSTVGGGTANEASGANSTVSGGNDNVASAPRGTIAGGAANVASGDASAVSGGSGNRAAGMGSAIAGGFGNVAIGEASAAGGGRLNCAGGTSSWVGGARAKARPGAASVFADACADVPLSGDTNGDEGTFMWADAQTSDFVSSGPNQFLVRAGGGVLFNTSTVVSPGVDDVTFRAGSGGDADIDLRLVTRTGKNVNLFVRDASGGLVVGLPSVVAGDTPRLSVTGPGGTATLSNGGTWTNASSRAFKDGITAIEPLDVLARLLALPISRWTYTGSTEGIHLGPMAEDFKAAFGLAGDGTSIATVDADGVALAAIQGLNAKLEAQNAALLARIAALEAALRQREGD